MTTPPLLPFLPRSARAFPWPRNAHIQHNLLATRLSSRKKDWPGSQTKLEQEAADGYRPTGVTISGMSTADASFLRTDATAAAFQHKLLHTILSSSLQKDINKLAAEGFRVSPGTLVVLQANRREGGAAAA